MTKLADDILITPALLRRFHAEAELEGGDGRYYAIVRCQDGKILAHHPGAPLLMPEQALWAGDVITLLNRELHHDGAWVVVFTHPIPPQLDHVLHDPRHWEYGRYVLLWLDRDGDVQIPYEWVKGESELLDWADVMLAGIECVGHKCEGAWQTWHMLMRQVIDPQEGETYKRAQGQAPKTSAG